MMQSNYMRVTRVMFRTGHEYFISLRNTMFGLVRLFNNHDMTPSLYLNTPD